MEQLYSSRSRARTPARENIDYSLEKSFKSQQQSARKHVEKITPKKVE
jgi:hypothetical protein